MGKKLNSRQRCASDVAGDVAGDKSLATGVHFRFGPCTLMFGENFGRAPCDWCPFPILSIRPNVPLEEYSEPL